MLMNEVLKRDPTPINRTKKSVLMVDRDPNAPLGI